jgi:hypothetical protein
MPPPKKILLAPNAPECNQIQANELEPHSEHSSGDNASGFDTSDSEDIDEANGSDGDIPTKLLTPPPTLAKKRKRSVKLAVKDGEHCASELRSYWQLKRLRF